ncbi:MAG: TSUP family transporter [Clostridia bacterium]|nr:TSUP family transporter [Clostridia bacterium]
MRIKVGRKAAISLIILVLCGAVGGFINGLLGAGGGIIITLALSRLLPKDEESRRSVFACSLCVTLPLSLLTLARYASSTDGSLSEMFSSFSASPLPLVSYGAELIFLAAAIGGVVGGLLLGRLGSAALSRIFAIICIVSGVLMII